MDLDYEGTVKWLYDLSKKERSNMRLGLDSVSDLCKRVGDPQDSFPSIHVAGTNGKGSVCHMIDAVLRASGTRTGLYTSPHLQFFSERVQVNGKPISEKEMVSLGKVLFPHVVDMGFDPTFFDVTTTLAFMYFERSDIEHGIIEVGLGGRLDSTNVLKEVDICVLTSFDMEHMDVLGNDIPSIAREKASILKSGCKAVVGDLPEDGMAVVNEIAKEKGVKEVLGCVNVDVLDMGLEGMDLRIIGSRADYELSVPLLGRHQAQNVGLAITALEAMAQPPTPKAVKEGLMQLRIPGRMEIVHEDPLVIIDGAHNPAAGTRLASTVKELFHDGEIIMLVGMMMDKDVEGFLVDLMAEASVVITTRANSTRALPSKSLTKVVGRRCERVIETDNVEEALTRAMDLAGKDGVVLATGSFYIAGEVKDKLMPVHHRF